jgi:hypothetical protein
VRPPLDLESKDSDPEVASRQMAKIEEEQAQTLKQGKDKLKTM